MPLYATVQELGRKSWPVKKCSSETKAPLMATPFDGEVAIRFPGLKGLDKSIVWVFFKARGVFDAWFYGVHRTREGIARAPARCFRCECNSFNRERDIRTCKTLDVRPSMMSRGILQLRY